MASLIRKSVPPVVILGVIATVGAGVLYKLGAPPPDLVSIEQLQLSDGIPVEVTHPVRMDFTDYLHCDGEVDEDVRAVLRAKIEEVVEAVHVRTGDRVSAGQLLVEFRTTDLDAAIASAEAAYQEASNNYERFRNLVEQQVVSPDRLEQARTSMENAATALRLARSRRAFAEIRSPIEGVVSERFVEPGEFASIGKELMTIVDLSTVEVRALVPEEHVPAIAVGQKAEFQLESGPQWFEGTVSRISPSTDDPNRFFDVFLSVENRRHDGRWLMRPGMYADVRFVKARYEDALALPAETIVFEGAERVAYLVEEVTVRVPVEPAPGTGVEQQSRSPGARIARGLDRVRTALGERFGAEAQTQGKEQRRFVEERQLQPVRMVLRVGIQSKGYVQVLEPELSPDSWVIVNPRDAVREGVKVRIVGGGQG